MEVADSAARRVMDVPAFAASRITATAAVTGYSREQLAARTVRVAQTPAVAAFIGRPGAADLGYGSCLILGTAD